MLAAATGFLGEEVALNGAGEAGPFVSAAFPVALLEAAPACWGPEPEARISRYASRSSRVKDMESDARARLFFWDLAISGALAGFSARSAGFGDIFIEIFPPFFAAFAAFGGLGADLSGTLGEGFFVPAEFVFAGAAFIDALKTVFFAPAAGFLGGIFCAGAFRPGAGFFAAAFLGEGTAGAAFARAGFAAGETPLPPAKSRSTRLQERSVQNRRHKVSQTLRIGRRNKSRRLFSAGGRLSEAAGYDPGENARYSISAIHRALERGKPPHTARIFRPTASDI